jgi:hypothetical protein
MSRFGSSLATVALLISTVLAEDKGKPSHPTQPTVHHRMDHQLNRVSHRSL